MAYILIILCAYNGFSSQQEYSTKEACETAQHIVQQSTGWNKIHAFCVRKGSD